MVSTADLREGTKERINELKDRKIVITILNNKENRLREKNRALRTCWKEHGNQKYE